MKFIFAFFIFLLPLFSLSAYETTNIQLLYSNNFDGDAFIYDTKNAKKTTVTLEHFRTWDYGDVFMFIDIMDGEKFDSTSSGIYTEFSPRFSLSKIFDADMSFGFIKDVYVATQVNLGRSYQAYLYGLGVDVEVPLFNVLSLNLYEKDENIFTDDTYQASAVYSTKSIYNIHFEGFIDITKRDINTQNQLLYNFDNAQHTYVGVEWLYYKYKYKGIQAKTSVLQAMIKYKF